VKPIYKNSVLIFLLFVAVYFTANHLSNEYFTSRTFNGCVDCHDEMTGFEESHSPEKVGCNNCHLGNPNTTNKDFAHKGMVLIPGNLSDASKTCGAAGCHTGIPERISTSLMNTMSGVISVNRFAFDELEKPEGLFNVKELSQSNADNHNRNLCASCHLGNEKIEWGAINELSRGGGCNACHLNYSDEAIEQLNRYLKSNIKGEKSNEIKNQFESFPNIHPQLSLKISNDHCFGCHSRSGRISTNYEGWYETLLNWDQVEGNEDYRLLMDGRVFQKNKEDVHYKAGMECIDCHVSMEVMGDGISYEHMEEATKVQCVDCHSRNTSSIRYDQLDFESKKIVNLRKTKRGNEEFLVTSKSNLPLVNTYVNLSNEKYLVTKSLNKKLPLNPPADICIEGQAHQKLSCNSCHTEWVTHCAGCHTEYDPQLEGYDLLDNKDILGSWNEVPSDFYVDYPVLGIRKDKTGKEIVDTFIPGMVLTIDKFKNPRKKIFKRLFAPTFAHTINKNGRSCKSCHNNPLALGYGKGKLSYNVNNKIYSKSSGMSFPRKWESKKSRTSQISVYTGMTNYNIGAEKNIINRTGYWIFMPQFSNHKEDSLPKDAWIGFLKTRDETSTTRTNTRPFTVEEQQRILLVGACLTCHEEHSEVMKESLIDWEVVLQRISQNCILPSN
jgi:nitrate/TMAO reductase-like tetraheme cytochrome c subunit